MDKCLKCKHSKGWHFGNGGMGVDNYYCRHTNCECDKFVSYKNRLKSELNEEQPTKEVNKEVRKV